MVETNTDGRILQLAVGFGQGAGMMMATEDALLAAVSSYESSVRRMDDWLDYAIRAIEFSRALGSLAAQHALRHARAVIDVPDVEFALKAVRLSELHPLGICRITESESRH